MQALAPPAADRAPQLPPPVRPRRHDDRVALDRHALYGMRPPPVAPDAFGEVESYGRGAPSGPLWGRSCQSYLFSTRELGKTVDGHPHKLPKSHIVYVTSPKYVIYLHNIVKFTDLVPTSKGMIMWNRTQLYSKEMSLFCF